MNYDQFGRLRKSYTTKSVRYQPAGTIYRDFLAEPCDVSDGIEIGTISSGGIVTSTQFDWHRMWATVRLSGHVPHSQASLTAREADPELGQT
jgi:hypothetical protein